MLPKKIIASLKMKEITYLIRKKDSPMYPCESCKRKQGQQFKAFVLSAQLIKKSYWKLSGQ